MQIETKQIPGGALAAPPGPPERRGSALRHGALRAVVVVGLSATLVGGGAAFLSVRDAEPAAPPAAVPAAPAAGLVNQSGVRGALAALQDRVRAVPKDWQALAALGSAYVEQSRLTGDPSWYAKADEAFAASMKLNTERNFAALGGLSGLAAARHDFVAALSYADKGLAINPASATLHGARTDALIELGRFDEAQTAVQTMADLRPDLAAYVRASYLRELNGDTATALEFMQEAEKNAGSHAEASFTIYHQGELKENSGRLDDAEADFTRAKQVDPTSVAAREGLARVAAARGRTAEAIAAFEGLVAERPLPAYAAALTDLYTIAGRPADAARQRDLLVVQGKLLAANGGNADLELALHSADNRVDVPNAVALARAEWAKRKSIHVADALAWALYADGKFAEAKTYADQALRIGTRNASFHFHRGMIHAAVGETAAARRDLETALSINPTFSPRHAEEARKTLAGLPS